MGGTDDLQQVGLAGRCHLYIIDSHFIQDDDMWHVFLYCYSIESFGFYGGGGERQMGGWRGLGERR